MREVARLKEIQASLKENKDPRLYLEAAELFRVLGQEKKARMCLAKTSILFTVPTEIWLEIMKRLACSDRYRLSMTCSFLKKILQNNTVYWLDFDWELSKAPAVFIDKIYALTKGLMKTMTVRNGINMKPLFVNSAKRFWPKKLESFTVIGCLFVSHRYKSLNAREIRINAWIHQQVLFLEVLSQNTGEGTFAPHGICERRIVSDPS